MQFIVKLLGPRKSNTQKIQIDIFEPLFWGSEVFITDKSIDNSTLIFIIICFLYTCWYRWKSRNSYYIKVIFFRIRFLLLKCKVCVASINLEYGVYYKQAVMKVVELWVNHMLWEVCGAGVVDARHPRRACAPQSTSRTQQVGVVMPSLPDAQL